MHKFLFISKDALIGDIIIEVIKGGDEAKYFIEDVDERDVADGFVPKTDNWEKEVDWADVIVFDDVLGQGALAEDLRKRGKLVVGGTAYTDMLEDDRSFGQRELKKHGIKIIPFWEFDDFDAAIKFVKENPDEYVIKPSGEAQNIKRLLFVGQEKDGADVVRILEAYKKVWYEDIKIFQLQKKVTGVEVAVGAFFNGHDFLYPININFENKKLFPGNLGPATGEMGTFMYWSQPNTLFNATLAKMKDTLAKEQYVGYIDINCIVNNFGIYPLEFTCRFGYPIISMQQESINMPFGDFLYQMADGQDWEFKVSRGFQVGVRVVVPPFPYRDKKTFDSYSKDSVVVFKNGASTAGIHIEDVKLVDNQWVLTGSAGVAVIAIGLGLTMKDAQKQVYARINNILIPNMYYRDDIGDRWYAEFDKLLAWGYLN